MRSLLETDEMVLPEKKMQVANGKVVWIFTVVLLLGVVKLFIGASRGRPVAFLVMLLFLAAVLFYVFSRKMYRTSLGDRTLRALRSQHAHETMRAAAFSTPDSSAGIVPLAIALYGLPILSASPLSPLESAMVPAGEEKKKDAGWFSSSGCGSGCTVGTSHHSAGCSSGGSSGCSSGGSSGCSGGGSSGCSSGCGGCGGGGH